MGLDSSKGAISKSWRRLAPLTNAWHCFILSVIIFCSFNFQYVFGTTKYEDGKKEMKNGIFEHFSRVFFLSRLFLIHTWIQIFCLLSVIIRPLCPEKGRIKTAAICFLFTIQCHLQSFKYIYFVLIIINGNGGIERRKTFMMQNYANSAK